MIDKNVPFVSNTPDDTHCFQAALKMLIGYYFPDEDYSWKQLDKISAKVKGLWTWPTAGLLWFQNKGLEVKIMEIFDHQRFVDEGESYLLEFYGKEVGSEQIAHSDIDQERKLAKKGLDKFSIERKIPKLDDIVDFLKQDFIIICLVNSKALNDSKGYVGHFVIIKGFFEGGLILHDPGLPPQKNRRVSNAQFERAWAYPDQKAKGIMAFRMKR